MTSVARISSTVGLPPVETLSIYQAAVWSAPCLLLDLLLVGLVSPRELCKQGVLLSVCEALGTVRSAHSRTSRRSAHSQTWTTHRRLQKRSATSRGEQFRRGETKVPSPSVRKPSGTYSLHTSRKLYSEEDKYPDFDITHH